MFGWFTRQRLVGSSPGSSCSSSTAVCCWGAVPELDRCGGVSWQGHLCGAIAGVLGRLLAVRPGTQGQGTQEGRPAGRGLTSSERSLRAGRDLRLRRRRADCRALDHRPAARRGHHLRRRHRQRTVRSAEHPRRPRPRPRDRRRPRREQRQRSSSPATPRRRLACAMPANATTCPSSR